MARPSKERVRLKDGEQEIGEDAHGIAIVECTGFFKIGVGVKWEGCEECYNMALTDTFGTYYHTLACSKSNGIGYNDSENDCFERENKTLPHREGCPCLTCKPKK